MGKFYESKLYMLCVWLFEMMKINVLSVVCSLPVFTLGASVSALYASVRSFAKDGTSPSKVFFLTFRKQLKRASLFTVAAIAIVLLTAGDIYIAVTSLSGPLASVFVWIPLIFCIVCVVTFGVLFPILPLFRAGYIQTVKIAFVFTMRYLLRSILCAIVNLMPVLLVLVFPYFMLRFIPIWLLIGFSLLAYSNTKLLLPVYSEIEQLLDEVSAEE